MCSALGNRKSWDILRAKGTLAEREGKFLCDKTKEYFAELCVYVGYTFYIFCCCEFCLEFLRGNLNQ